MVVYKRPSAPTPPEPSLSTIPFTIKALDDNSQVMLCNDNGATYINLQYSKNGGAWTPVTINDPIYLNEGETVAFSGNNPSGFSNGTGDYKFSNNYSGCRLQAYGNIMSLLTGNYLNVNDFSFMQVPERAFRYLFNEYWCLEHASGLVLPASSVPDGCYDWMFFGQFNMITPPQMLATEFGNGSCANMFYNCSNLIDGPQIFATSAYQSDSFGGMFNNCSSLSGIKVHFTEWKHDSDWVADVAANGTFYKPAALSEEYGNDRIPNGWTVVDN